MPDQPTQPQMPDLLYWQVPEYEKHQRNKKWYIIAGVITVALILYSLFHENNFLFPFIIVVAAIIIILNDGREPDMIKISLTGEGINIGRKFYDYDEIKNFSIIYKPNIEVKNLYFEFKNVMKHRISIPLGNLNPLIVRDILLKYLPEDLERENEPLSESLAKILKLG
jgi:hypothetical protein